MHPITLSRSYKAFLALLNAGEVEFLVVGGFAVQYYGYSRPTKDLDVWTAATLHNARKLVEACRAFGLPGLPEEPFQHQNRIMRLQIPPISMTVMDPIIGQAPATLGLFNSGEPEQIEILTVQSGVRFEECYAAGVEDFLDGVAVKLVSLKHLKAIKVGGNRPKDLEDLDHLSRRPGL